jgi:hypothetical protein
MACKGMHRRPTLRLSTIDMFRTSLVGSPCQCVQAAGKAISEGCKTYFYAQFVAYILGLVTTVVFMTVYKTAQVPYSTGQHKNADHCCSAQAPPYTLIQISLATGLTRSNAIERAARSPLPRSCGPWVLSSHCPRQGRARSSLLDEGRRA